MDPIWIICDDRRFKTRRRTITNLFGDIPDDQTELRLDIDPDEFLPILEELRENFETLSTSEDFKDKIKEIPISDINLDVGGKIFTTSKQTLCKSDYFKASFSSQWNNDQITFIDRDPTKFGQLLDHLRGNSSDPGPYGDFYLVSKPILTVNDTSNFHNTWIIRDQPFHFDDPGRCRITLETLYDDETTVMKLALLSTAGQEHEFILDHLRMDEYVNNIKFVSNRGLESILFSIDDTPFFCDDSKNSHIFENIRSLPTLVRAVFQRYKFKITLTRPGFVQMIYDNHQLKGELRRNLPIPKQIFVPIYYYGRTDTIIPNCPPFNRCTMTIIIRRNPDYENLTLSSNSDMLIRSIDPISHAEYLKAHPEANPDFYYIKVQEDPISAISRDRWSLLLRQENIKLNYITDIWVLNMNKLMHQDGCVAPLHLL